ncbi:uncharacterized protein BDW43DRAFT_265090 [Aspergillus alliaceus]|uniref:uncharacterized protein n=1 Tax=Petromyces alliaceus TaxID=209559 RepID=UPI0012A641EF|nr:uncharacterized protein BDW43DRAFT_265090 [Aspergillus alliaceus]KAB8237279.1 hypothetical protein BDW43DRAFT_265090 [Aspergillus alliaceus]
MFPLFARHIFKCRHCRPQTCSWCRRNKILVSLLTDCEVQIDKKCRPGMAVIFIHHKVSVDISTCKIPVLIYRSWWPCKQPSKTSNITTRELAL